jgi:hypothetical protein
MTARECSSVAGWWRAPARVLEVCLYSTCVDIPSARYMVHALGIHRRGSKPVLCAIHPAVGTGHYSHVHGHDPIQIT